MYLCLFYKSLSFLRFSFPIPPTTTVLPQFTRSKLIICMLCLTVRSTRAYWETSAYFAVVYHIFRQDTQEKGSKHPLERCHWTTQIKKTRWKSQAASPSKTSSRPFHYPQYTCSSAQWFLCTLSLPSEANSLGKEGNSFQFRKNK